MNIWSVSCYSWLITCFVLISLTLHCCSYHHNKLFFYYFSAFCECGITTILAIHLVFLFFLWLCSGIWDLVWDLISLDFTLQYYQKFEQGFKEVIIIISSSSSSSFPPFSKIMIGLTVMARCLLFHQNVFCHRVFSF